MTSSGRVERMPDNVTAIAATIADSANTIPKSTRTPVLSGWPTNIVSLRATTTTSYPSDASNATATVIVPIRE